MKINPANQLTLLRLALIPVYLAFVIHDNFYTRLIALVIFIGASLTDLYDGRLARARGIVTTLGTFLDPLADKLLISAAFIAFVQVDDFYVPAWMVVLIIGREFLITGLRTLAVSQGRTLSAQPAGKFKTTSQVVAILSINLIMITHSFFAEFAEGMSYNNEFGERFWSAFLWTLNWGPFWLTFVTTVLTILSGYIYIRKNIDLFHERPIGSQ